MHPGEHGKDHGQAFLDYYERASVSDRTIGRFSRIRDCALMLAREQGSQEQRLDVVDIGCGAATQAMLWAEQGHRVAALDASESLVAIGQQRARDRGLSIDFRVGVAQALPFSSEGFDVVLMPELLEHVAQWEECLIEAVRVLRAGGVLYVSTTNKLCPVQQEFNLPLYSWYPPALKRWCEAKAVSTRPEWANHTRYPAVNWFSYYGLEKWFDAHGVDTLDRFDILSRQRLNRRDRAVVALIQRYRAFKFLAQTATEGTMVWGLKRAAAR